MSFCVSVVLPFTSLQFFSKYSYQVISGCKWPFYKCCLFQPIFCVVKNFHFYFHHNNIFIEYLLIHNTAWFEVLLCMHINIPINEVSFEFLLYNFYSFVFWIEYSILLILCHCLASYVLLKILHLISETVYFHLPSTNGSSTVWSDRVKSIRVERCCREAEAEGEWER